MNYFEAIAHRASELDDLGQKYLDGLPFMDNEQVLRRLWDIAVKLHRKSPETAPEWVEWVLDGWIPFGPSRNGSLYYLLGYAMVAADARLRNLLEVSEGRSEGIDLATVAEKDVVDSYCKDA